MKLNVYAKGSDLVLVDEDNASECAGLKAKGYKDSEVTPEEFNQIKFADPEKRDAIEKSIHAAAAHRQKAKEKAEADAAAKAKAEADAKAGDKK